MKPDIFARVTSLYSLTRLFGMLLPWSATLLIWLGEDSVTAKLMVDSEWMPWFFVWGPIILLLDWFWVVVLYRKPVLWITCIAMTICSLYMISISFMMRFVLNYAGVLTWVYLAFGVVTFLGALRLGQPFSIHFLSRHAADHIET